MAGGRMHTPHPTSLDPPLAISYRNHQKILAYFTHLAPLVLFFFSKRQNQKGGAWHNAPPTYTSAARSSSCNYPCQNMAVISDRDNFTNNFVSMWIKFKSTKYGMKYRKFEIILEVGLFLTAQIDGARSV